MFVINLVVHFPSLARHNKFCPEIFLSLFAYLSAVFGYNLGKIQLSLMETNVSYPNCNQIAERYAEKQIFFLCHLCHFGYSNCWRPYSVISKVGRITEFFRYCNLIELKSYMALLDCIGKKIEFFISKSRSRAIKPFSRLPKARWAEMGSTFHEIWLPMRQLTSICYMFEGHYMKAL